MKTIILAIFLIFILSTKLIAQNSDLDLIKEHFKTDKSERIVPFGISGSKHFFVKYNPISLGFGGLMFVYQKYIAQQSSSNCPYSPTCSEYGKQLIKRYGLIKGIPCAADRLMRCNSATVSGLHWKRNLGDHHIHEQVDYYQFTSNAPATNENVKENSILEK